MSNQKQLIYEDRYRKIFIDETGDVAKIDNRITNEVLKSYPPAGLYAMQENQIKAGDWIAKHPGYMQIATDRTDLDNGVVFTLIMAKNPIVEEKVQQD